MLPPPNSDPPEPPANWLSIPCLLTIQPFEFSSGEMTHRSEAAELPHDICWVSGCRLGGSNYGLG